MYDASIQETKKFTGFSHTIPMDVYNAHQMPKVAIGKEQVSFNLAEQLDGAFMLSQSASDRATLIGKITGVQSVDTAIKEIGKEISNKQKDNKSTEREIERLTNEMGAYTHLPNMLKEIEFIETTFTAIESAENEIKDLSMLEQDINNFNINLAVENQKYQSFANLDDVKKLLDDIDKTYQEYLLYEQLECELLNNSLEQCEVMSKINSYTYLDTLKIIIDNIPIASADVGELSIIESELDLVNKSINSEKNKLNNLCQLTQEQLTEIDKIYKEYQDYANLEAEDIIVNNEVSNAAADICRYEYNLKNYNEEYKKLLNSVPGGVCPICSGHLDSEKINTLSL